MNDMKTFIPLNVSSKFAICGLPIRLDTYKTCSFGCSYCFANNRKIMEFDKNLQIANIKWLERKLHKVLVDKNINENDFLEKLISNGITFHCGGMSDPFQPCEKDLGITKKVIEICNKHNIHILFSTKSDTVYDCDIRPDLHSFQLSITNTEDRVDIEPNVPSINRRIKFYNELKNKGFKVGIRIQPFIPNISTIKIIETFKDADNFTLEGLKLVPQNKEHKEYLLSLLNLDINNFTQKGLLNLKPDIRLNLYTPFIEYFNKNKSSYSIADNDLHHLGNNKCCCGDSLINKYTKFNNTTMVKDYGESYSLDNVISELNKEKIGNCKCNNLFTSNRQEKCKTVNEFYNKRFFRKTSPFSPRFLYKEER